MIVFKKLYRIYRFHVFLAQENIIMSNIEIKVYKEALHQEICEKYERAEDFINKKLDEISLMKVIC